MLPIILLYHLKILQYFSNVQFRLSFTKLLQNNAFENAHFTKKLQSSKI